MSSTAATSVTAEAEQLPRKGAARPAVATSDHLFNRERQSLAQATQMAARLALEHPGLVHAVKHVASSAKCITHIIFSRSFIHAPDEDDEDEGEGEDAAPAAPKPKAQPT